MSFDDHAGVALASPDRTRAVQRRVVIEARAVEKTFRIPHVRVDSIKERVSHPFSLRDYRELHALRNTSFDVNEGEFFGIVGRNGSGKSTLLKILASIYRADGGSVRIAGRLAPFIELGVGFNPELTSRENVVLNGVLMGLSRQEAARTLDTVLDFADLRDFIDLKLKNYSSGMMARLAFAVMVEADADIMLIDEVLAVGDAAFAQKCMDVFRQRRAAGKTIVLVTHDMSTVLEFCDRAMLIDDGEPRYIGDPEEAALRYYRLNFGGPTVASAGLQEVWSPDVNVRLIDAWLESDAGERIDNVQQGEPIGLNVIVEARHDLAMPVFALHFQNADGVEVFGVHRMLRGDDGGPAPLGAGQRVRISGKVENPLVPGRYFVTCWVSRTRSEGDFAMQTLRLLDFYVYGTRPGPGSVTVQADVEAVLEPAPRP
jgi:ABC-type polysaccharide/polyol phosphate transport system ATPase subunit